MSITIRWNGRDLPAELSELPPGEYELRPIDEPLTSEDLAAIERARASLLRGEGIDGDVVMTEARALLTARKAG